MLAIRGFGGLRHPRRQYRGRVPVTPPLTEAHLRAPAEPTSRDRRRWAKYLVNERAEAQVYRQLAARRDGEERDILLALVDAEGRHEAHWLTLLGGEPRRLPRPDAGTVLLGWLAKRFGSIFVLALAQNAEARSPYETEPFATPAMAADEKIHHEVVRGLAARGRRRLSGTFRAAVFGANDGLVSNLALVMGVGATGRLGAVRALQRHRRPARRRAVDGRGRVRLGALAARAARGDRAEQLRRQRAARPRSRRQRARTRLSHTRDVGGGGARRALARSSRRRSRPTARSPTDRPSEVGDDHEVVGSAWRAALSSFLFFASGAIIPVLPWIFGLSGLAAVVLGARARRDRAAGDRAPPSACSRAARRCAAPCVSC